MKKALILIGISASLVGCSLTSNEPKEDITEKVTEKDTVETENKKPVINKEPVENKPKETEVKTETEKETETETETSSTNVQPSTQEPEKTSDASTDTDKDKKPQKDVVKNTTTGVFYGIADSNSIEVDYDNDVNTLLFNNKLYDKINEIPYEAKIKFTYITNENGQNVITEIDTIQ